MDYHLRSLLAVAAVSGLIIGGVPRQARADEFNGFSSNAVTSTEDNLDSNSWIQAYRHPGSPINIRIETGPGAIGACSISLSMPSGASDISHPALTRSGSIFVSASVSGVWHLYRSQNSNFNSTPCSGWGGWTLWDPPGGSVTTAPTVTHITDIFEYLAVGGGDGAIHIAIKNKSGFGTPYDFQWRWASETWVTPGSEIALAYFPSGYRFHMFWKGVGSAATIWHLGRTIGLLNNGDFDVASNSYEYRNAPYTLSTAPTAIGPAATFSAGTPAVAVFAGGPDFPCGNIHCINVLATQHSGGGTTGWTNALDTNYPWDQFSVFPNDPNNGHVTTISVPLFGFRNQDYNGALRVTALIQENWCSEWWSGTNWYCLPFGGNNDEYRMTLEYPRATGNHFVRYGAGTGIIQHFDY